MSEKQVKLKPNFFFYLDPFNCLWLMEKMDDGDRFVAEVSYAYKTHLEMIQDDWIPCGYHNGEQVYILDYLADGID